MNNLYINKLTLPQSVNISIIKENNTPFEHFYIYNFLFFYKLPIPQNIKSSQLDLTSNSIIFLRKSQIILVIHLSVYFLYFYFHEIITFLKKLNLQVKVIE